VSTDPAIAPPLDKPTPPKLFWSDVVLAGLGLSTTILSALSLALLNLRAHVALYAFLVWGVIPGGAICCGLVSAIGFELGARVLGKRPGRVARAGILLSGPLGYALIFVFQYLLLDVNGTPISSVLSFGTFVDTVIRGATIKFGSTLHTPQLGAAGYGLVALQAGGFFLGGLGVFAMPSMGRPACAQCGRYLSEPATVTGSGTAAELRPQFAYARKLLSEANSKAASTLIGALPQNDASHRLRLETRACAACELEYCRLSVLEWGYPAPERGKQPPATWIPVTGLDVGGQVSAAGMGQKGVSQV